MPRPVQAQIRRSALRHNLNVAMQQCPQSKVLAVVKADAYGHGLLATVEAWSAADGLALVEFDQAQRLREAGYRGRVLMLEGAFDEHDLRLALEATLCLVVHCQEQLDMLISFWRHLAQQGHLPGRIDVFLKFNSGMNRLGFGHDGFRRAAEALAHFPGLNQLVLMTHFADADIDGGAHAAILSFQRGCEGLRAERSMANSAAVFALPEAHCQWVRPGVMLYGASPFDLKRGDKSALALGLKPAMSLTSELIAVQHLEAGDHVGYGSTFEATQAMRIGVVACGYADGYPRHAPTGTPVLVDGARCATVGRVAMDMLMVDLTPAPQAHVGSVVELWGEALGVDEVAAHAGTIGYELLCALAPRVRKVYLD
jgi:alanine racemase